MTKKKKKKFLPGTVVEAKCVITDVGPDGERYIHAMKGTLGIVLISGTEHDDFPNIQWGPHGEGGVCNVTAEEIKPYAGKVVCAVDE